MTQVQVWRVGVRQVILLSRRSHHSQDEISKKLEGQTVSKWKSQDRGCGGFYRLAALFAITVVLCPTGHNNKSEEIMIAGQICDGSPI